MSCVVCEPYAVQLRPAVDVLVVPDSVRVARYTAQHPMSTVKRLPTFRKILFPSFSWSSNPLLLGLVDGRPSPLGMLDPVYQSTRDNKTEHVDF